jgi:uncharacterized membrane protein YgcG
MRRTLTLILGVALFGILAAVVVASQGADDPVGTTNTSTTTGTVERTTTVEDNPNRVRDDDGAARGIDISGPCDEAEHANDPRCTGQSTAPQGDDNPGVDDGNHGQVDNSGPGSSNSGPGGGDDDNGFDDHGGGGDNSGPGGGGGHD